MRDLGSQFFLREIDVGVSRAEASFKKVQDLNYYVSVEVLKDSLNEKTLSILRDYTVVILTDSDLESALVIGEYCHREQILFIWAGILGMFGHAFIDFGDHFDVFDKDGR